MKRVENKKEFISSRQAVYRSRVETELQNLVAKQLKTDVSLHDVKSFISSNKQLDPICLLEGVTEVSAYRAKLAKLDRESSLLQDGLSEEEVRITMKQLGNEGGFPRDPLVREEEYNAIQTRMARKHESVQQQSNNVNSLTVSRHELELEISATAFNPLRHLIGTDSVVQSDKESVLIWDSLRAIESRGIANRKRRRLDNDTTNKELEISPNSEIIVNKCSEATFETHQLTQTDPSHVSTYRLSLTEIRQIPRFSSYAPGLPSRKLFIKNLHRNVSLEDLASLFIRFQQESGPRILFRLLTGRMKGQAFVEFNSIAQATEALYYSTGFILKGKPVIAVYASNRSDT